MIGNLLVMLLPWLVKKQVLRAFYGYEIGADCFIGLSYVFPEQLIMKDKAKIGHLTLCKGLRLVEMGARSEIGRFNWITGYPHKSGAHFTHVQDRQPDLILGQDAAITQRHMIDCTDKVTIGKFATIGGYYSQILTHSIDFGENRQTCSPVVIGAYTFVGTNCVILKGSRLPDHSLLPAKSLLNQYFPEEWRMYGGVPAKKLTEIDTEQKYFTRANGFVH